MNSKDIEEILYFAKIYYGEMSLPIRLADMNKDLNNAELVAISYYKSVVQILIKKGSLPKEFDLNIKLYAADSEVSEDDYI